MSNTRLLSIGSPTMTKDRDSRFEDLDLWDFAGEVNRDLDRFIVYWMENRNRYPVSHPARMDHAGWWDRFSDFLATLKD